MIVRMDKDKAINALSDALQPIGYGSDSLEEHFPIPIGSSTVESYADIVAFGDSVQKDQKTACIVGRWMDSSQTADQLLEPLCGLACPISVLLTPQNAQFWAVHTVNPVREWKSEIVTYDELTNFLKKNIATFDPRTLMAAKKGIILQRSLFDHDPQLLDYAMKVTGRELSKRVEDAVSLGREELGSKEPNDIRYILSATIRLVAAQAISEKLRDLPSSLCVASADVLLPQVRTLFPGYFPPDEILSDTTLTNMLEILRSGMTFRALTNEVLSDVYETVFLDSQDHYRKCNGIHYTPSSLAHQILAKVPLELFPSDERVVLDPTCGSGSFLRAAYDRLADLLPRWYTPTERHDYLSKKLYGIDSDQVAKDIAVLSLLIHSLPSGNSWNVNQGSFPEDMPVGLKPAIIVGNPPFGGEGEDAQSASDRMRGIRHRTNERAMSFLLGSINHLVDGGIIAMILPESFIESNKCQHGRDALFAQSDIFELWHLPRDMMPMSTAATVVLFARKINVLRSVNLPIKVQWTLNRQTDRNLLLQHGIPTVFTLTSPNHDSQEKSIAQAMPKPIMWKRLADNGQLSQYAEVWGGQPSTGACVIFNDQGPTWHKWLQSLKHLYPYHCYWTAKDDGYVQYPGNFTEPRTQKVVDNYHKPKVLVNAKSKTGSNTWRLYGAPDYDNVYPSGLFHCIVPKDGSDIGIEEITAIINSPVANAWMCFVSNTWSNQKTHIKQIPFPHLTKQQKSTIRSLVGTLARIPVNEDPIVRYKYKSQIDAIIFNAYELTDEECDWFKCLFAGFRPPKEEWSTDEVGLTIPPIAHRETAGIVREIDSNLERIRIWLYNEELDESEIWIDIPPDYPGWALRPGAMFGAKILNGNHNALVLSSFRMLDYGYLSDEELLADFKD